MMLGPGSSVVVVLELGGRDITEFAVEAAVAEPVDPGEGLELDVFDVAPGAASADEFGLESPFTISARALSFELPMLPMLPMLPIDARAQISPRRSV